MAVQHWDDAELNEALELETSPQPSPLSDRSSGFSYSYELNYAHGVMEREGSPRRRRPPSKKRARSTAQQQQQRSQHDLRSHLEPQHMQHQPQCIQTQRHSCDPDAALAPPVATPLAAVRTAAPSPVPQVPSPAAQAPGSGACPLQALPLQLLVRLLSFLSAQDLAAAARSSTLLRSLSDEPTLWRRLFCARWGKPRGPQQLPPKTWKARYVERDLAELAEARARALGAGGGSGGDGEGSAGGGGLAAAAAADAFVEAQLAKRQRALGRAHVDDPMEVTDDVARRVEAWRAARGFAPLSRVGAGSGAPAPAPGAGADAGREQAAAGQGLAPGGPAAAQRQQQQQQQQQQQASQQQGGNLAGVHRWCRVAGAGDVYCCEATGDVHVCDSTCTEHVLERTSGLLVCPISGTVRDDLRSVCLPPCEGEGEDEEDAATAAEGDWGGRLARAFELGYYAESLEELERTCFVPLPRRGS
ncbi:hypothetical protein MNEG_2412 [Monoraphidium neglectum]|uniref:F-box domain-containing protein n=1 Tax=Monoraphidium neglectum TaxID=145388 RepID=A0A0D2K528_9CHLO|nr:hypothetical protein MNEG_2412 [Monoraphidium neglectum]KIZ05543.1 hypothetical protein MNEG_2412 [Monoraphidium neglectum]|eukprot:XP_013904562.1 hypothetical protein MNEG_2412 [Monoraphidium neglectum]